MPPQGEQEPGYRGGKSRLRPFELPADLAGFLAETRYALPPHATNRGAVFVLKAPAADIAALVGRIPIELDHELYQHELAPVIRTVVRLFDRPDRPLILETFTNVAEEDQWADFTSLAER